MSKKLFFHSGRVGQAHMTKTSSSVFGVMMMADDPLIVGPEPGSKFAGKAQGIYGSAAQDETGLLGRNTVFSAVRKMPIVGGSRAFRFARGYAQAKTHTFDFKTGDAVVEYNVSVFHYQYTQIHHLSNL